MKQIIKRWQSKIVSEKRWPMTCPADPVRLLFGQVGNVADLKNGKAVIRASMERARFLAGSATPSRSSGCHL